jgi:sulfoxide reductase catalytic subunit YedY
MSKRALVAPPARKPAPGAVVHENELGFKMVKWIAAIEFVHDFADLGAGQGGYNEDHEFYGYRMAI